MAINLSKNEIPQYVEPQPVAVDEQGKKLYLVKSIKDNVEYTIWAASYKQALELLPLIENA